MSGMMTGAPVSPRIFSMLLARMTTPLSTARRAIGATLAWMTLALSVAAPASGAPLDDGKMVFSRLPATSVAALDDQRARVEALTRRVCGRTARGDLRARISALQCLFDRHALGPSDEAGWSAVGVVFGDALVAAHPGLEWRQVEDGYGIAPVLQYKRRKIEVAPVDMLLKRIDGGDVIDFDDLVRATGETLARQLPEAADDN